ncbi:CUB and peptidase domain-containing protein 1-like [Porites lutea]|uniref:CUB and peptidase domain-containing protein 1-like n=1 Tax=Porites lutea TaxID=51062 RepID=UPI003CC6D59E
MKFVFALSLMLCYSSAQSADPRCGSVVNNTLTSPKFPTPYPNNMHCVYNVSIPSGKALKISFSNFSLGLRYGRCWYDYLRIVDDDNRTLGTYCGRELSGKVVLVNGNYALITFHSYRYAFQRYPGFQLTILFTENGMFK